MMTLKKIAKYTTNILGFISMILVGLNAIEGLDIPHCVIIIEIIAVIKGAIETCLLGQKIINKGE